MRARTAFLLLLLVILSSASSAAGAATRKIATVPAAGLEALFLVGSGIGWVSYECRDGCSEDDETSFRETLRHKPAGKAPRTIASRDGVSAVGMGSSCGDSDSWLLSPSHFVTVAYRTCSADSVTVSVAPLGGRPEKLVECPAPYKFGPPGPAVDLSGRVVAYTTCEPPQTLIVRDLGTGERRELTGVEPEFELAGSYVAYFAASGLEVVNWRSGERAYRVPVAAASELRLRADGRVLYSTSTREYCRGEVFTAAPSHPAPVRLAQGCGLRLLDDGYTVSDAKGRIRHGADDGPPARLLVDPRAGGPRFVDAAGERVLLRRAECTHTYTAFERGTEERTTTGGRPTSCPVALRSRRVVAPRSRRATLRLSCPRGCAGKVAVRRRGVLLAHGRFRFGPGRHVARLRVTRRGRRAASRRRAATLSLLTHARDDVFTERRTRRQITFGR